MEEKNTYGSTMGNESSANIRLNKSEIEKVIRSLILSLRISEMFLLEEDFSCFVKLKDDFMDIKKQLEEKEESYETRNKIKKKVPIHRETCEECD